MLQVHTLACLLHGNLLVRPYPKEAILSQGGMGPWGALKSFFKDATGC